KEILQSEHVEPGPLVHATQTSAGSIGLPLTAARIGPAVRRMTGHSESTVGRGSTFVLCTGKIGDVALTRDGRTAVSASDDMRLKVWDIPTGECIQVLEGHSHHITTVAMMPNQTQCVSASQNGEIILWELAEGGCLRSFLHS